MQRGDRLAVALTAVASAADGIGAQVQEPSDGVGTTGGRRPDQRRAAVDVGLQARAVGDERFEHARATAASRIGERLVEHLLRIVGWCPGGKAGVRPVEAAVGAGRGCAGERLDERGIARAGRGAQVARLHAAPRDEEVRDLPVAPEQRSHQRRAAVAAGGRVAARSGVEQDVHEVLGVRVADLVAVVDLAAPGCRLWG